MKAQSLTDGCDGLLFFGAFALWQSSCSRRCRRWRPRAKTVSMALSACVMALWLIATATATFAQCAVGIAGPAAAAPEGGEALLRRLDIRAMYAGLRAVLPLRCTEQNPRSLG
jgi:hypothetical protein